MALKGNKNKKKLTIPEDVIYVHLKDGSTASEIAEEQSMSVPTVKRIVKEMNLEWYKILIDNGRRAHAEHCRGVRRYSRSSDLYKCGW